MRTADAVYSNLRGTAPRGCASATPTSPEVNPRVVCCALTGFGMTGPRAEEGGYDYILQGYAGWMSLTGEPDGPPGQDRGSHSSTWPPATRRRSR